jgi:hypothetical protein
MSPLNVVWPTQPKIDPNGIQRFARVVHWGCCTGAAICLLAGFNDVEALPAFAAGALGLCMFGRTLRYILAGE